MEQTIENRGSQDSSAEADRLRQEVFVKPEEGKVPETGDTSLKTRQPWEIEWTPTLDKLATNPDIKWNIPSYENWKLENAKPTAAQLAREQLEPKYDTRFDITDPNKEARERFDEMRTVRLPLAMAKARCS